MKNVADYLAMLADVSYPGLTFHVAADGGDRYYLQVQGTEIDHTTDLSVGVRGRKWMLSPFMTRSEIVQTALMAVLAYNEHEAREAFKYRGRAVFGPHIDVDVLHEHCEVLDTRADPVDPAKYAIPQPWSWGYVTCKKHGAVWQDRNLGTACWICKWNADHYGACA